MNLILMLVITFIVGFVVGAISVWMITRSNTKSLRETFDSVSKKALAENQETFFQVAQDKFKSIMDQSDGKLDEKKKLIDSNLQEMNRRLETLNTNTNTLKDQLQFSGETLKNLSIQTTDLKEVLSNSQKIGKWGEKIVEDILGFIGLTEGVNYKKQVVNEETKSRPDFTFFLPNDLKINMDVKFPFSDYEKYLTANTEEEKSAHQDAFLKAVRNHLKTIENRDYIDVAHGTVNYVLMFIPNEGVYSYLNSVDREIIDFALSRRIVICSPVTLYAILSLVRQAVNSFTMEKKAGEIQKQIIIFKKAYEEFHKVMDKTNKAIGSAYSAFSELMTTKSRKLEIPMKKITDLDAIEIVEAKAEVEPKANP